MREGRGAMTRVPFALLLAISLPITVARAAPSGRFVGAHSAGAPQPRTAAAAAPRVQVRCHARDVSVTSDPYALLVRITAAALRVAARVFQLPGWTDAHDGPSGCDDLRAAIDTLWSCLSEASRTTVLPRGNAP